MVTKTKIVTITYTVSAINSTALSQPIQADVPLGKRKHFACWNIGIPGMKVGGVRRITSPPEHAYGPNGAPPFISGDATVIFEVTIINCN